MGDGGDKVQIRTALAIGSGIVIGVILGMGVSEDTKCKILGKIRKKLIYALGGEDKKNYTAFRNPTYHGTYASYVKNAKKEPKKIDIPDQDLLKFDSYDEAEECVNAIEIQIMRFKCFTVIDLAHYRNRALDYAWDAYGWEMEDLKGRIDITKISGKFILDLPRPKLLLDKKE